MVGKCCGVGVWYVVGWWCDVDGGWLWFEWMCVCDCEWCVVVGEVEWFCVIVLVVWCVDGGWLFGCD